MINFSIKHALLCIASSLLLSLEAQGQSSVHVYGASWVDFPLVKKIGLYQTPLVSKSWLTRDIPKLAELEVRSMRYEMACGKDDLYGQPCVTGTTSKLTYNLNDINYLLSQCKKHSPVLVISHGYTPTLLQRRPTEWSGFMDPPTDLSTWATINRRFAREWKVRRYTNSYVEIWNEPDLKDGFFTGTVDDYLNIYEAAAPAVSEGYSDIKVGGPAGAFSGWHQPLVDRVKSKDLPLDFLSGHAYGTEYAWQLNDMRNALNRLGRNEAEMLLTEYSPYAAADYQADGPVERAESAMTFFNALPGMLEYTDLTYVNWAQFIDPGFFVGDKLGIIDRDSGSRKALFNAFKLYGMMPADRRRINIVSTKLQGMASASDHCVAAVVWNTKEGEEQMRLTLDALPFQNGQLEVYHIDESHNSWYETHDQNLVASRSEHFETTTGSISINEVVRSKGVCFVRFVADNAPTLFPTIKLGNIIRTHQWFPNRTNTASYALFDPKTWTIRMSSNKEAKGRALVGIEAENMPDVIKVEGLSSGHIIKREASSTLNIRVDYQATDGTYTHSTLYHAGIYSATNAPKLPWGTGREADTVVEVEDMNNFTIDIAAHKPTDFNGRIIISFDMQSVGSSVKQNYQLSQGTATGIKHIEALTPANTEGKEAVYNLQGQRMNALHKGINIVRSSNGQCSKVFIKK